MNPAVEYQEYLNKRAVMQEHMTDELKQELFALIGLSMDWYRAKMAAIHAPYPTPEDYTNQYTIEQNRKQLEQDAIEVERRFLNYLGYLYGGL